MKLIDEEDVKKFAKACEEWVKEHCKDKVTATNKLIEMGLYNPDGSLHNNYK